MSTRAELVAALNTHVPSSLEICVKVGDAYYPVKVADVKQVKLFKRDGRLTREGSADESVSTFVCICGDAP